MRALLWVLQLLLAVAFIAHGLMLLVPPESVVEQLNASLPRWFQLFLGVAEVAAGLGITLPGMTRIMPQLVPAAGGGIMFVMISATIYHVVRSEISSAIITLVLLVMASYVTYMRWRVLPIRPRGRRTLQRLRVLGSAWIADVEALDGSK